MEITIFRKNEVVQGLFENQELYTIEKYKHIHLLKIESFGNFTDLDKTKSRLDLLDKNSEKYRRAAAKYLHEYELVKILSKKQVLSRAYFKLCEIIYFEPIIKKENCDCFFICEAPGGFIECVCDIRRKHNLKTNYISVSKNDSFIKYGNYLEDKNLFYGDITDVSTLEDTVKRTNIRFPNGLDFITADGGFDIKIFIAQEIISSKLLLCEIYLALKTQKVGGMFVIKFFDMFSHNSIMYYLILCSFYSYVKIIKPKSSRNCNSERYLVCCDFKGKSEMIDKIFTVISNFQLDTETITKIFPNFCFDLLPNLTKLCTFNNLIIYQQIKTINESIKMVNTKNTYIQNLLLNMFINKTFEINKPQIISTYKNILNTRIKKCTDFLKLYCIQINQYLNFKDNY
jgi:23S rRNA U2552 (ribose-2'-O)-methylase RlmE/FtsJ